MQNIVLIEDFRDVLKEELSRVSQVPVDEIAGNTNLYEPKVNGGLGFDLSSDPVPSILDQTAALMLRKTYARYNPPTQTPGGEYLFKHLVQLRFSWICGVGVTAHLDVIRRALKAQRIKLTDPLKFTQDVAQLNFPPALERLANERLLSTSITFDDPVQAALLRCQIVSEAHDVLAKFVLKSLRSERGLATP